MVNCFKIFIEFINILDCIFFEYKFFFNERFISSVMFIFKKFKFRIRIFKFLIKNYEFIRSYFKGKLFYVRV